MDNIEKIDLNNVDWQSSREFFDSLKDQLEKLDDHNESYEFTWVGKRKSLIEAGAPINKTLRPDVEASKDFDNTKNMLIVGDNLDALKILQESYLGQVKMIYIDPPYNTGHDFVYHDNFTAKKTDYTDSNTGEDDESLVDEDPMKLNAASNGRFHSDWLSMIYPRLKLARNLLSDDGVIFISIDDNEQANLKKVCDEVFGEENFVECLIWKKRATPPNDKNIGRIHEFILVYAKCLEAMQLGLLPRDENSISRYANPDNDTRGAWAASDLSANGKGGRLVASCIYPIVNPSTGIEYYPSEGRCWLFNKNKMQQFINEGRIGFRPETGAPFLKRYLSEVRNGLTLPTILTDYGYSSTSAAESEKLFTRKGIFEYAKPTTLINPLVRIGAPNDSLILDFFAGSGTTGHAVMDLNAEDGGNRRYILVQWPETTNEKSEARKAGYETIDQITAERLRRAGEKVQKEHPDAKIDTGFRIFRIDSSNEKDNIRKPLDEYTQESMLDMVENLKPDRTPLDLLFGAIYVSALPFDRKLEVRQIGDNTVYLYGYLGEGSGLVACFDDNIAEASIQEIAKLKALTAVFKDSSFANSSAKVNLSEHFRILSGETKVKVI